MSDSYARRIAARGITPNHVGSMLGENGDVLGTLVAFEHFDHTTWLLVRVPSSEKGIVMVEYDIPHLDEVTVYD